MSDTTGGAGASGAVGSTGEAPGDAQGDREKPVVAKPISPAKEAEIAAGGTGGEQPRGPDGKFLPIGADSDGGIPDKDYPVAHLPGLPDERKTAPAPKPERFQRGARRMLERAAQESVPRPDGVAAGGAQAASLVEPGSAADQAATGAKAAPIGDPNAPPTAVPKPGPDGQPPVEQPAKYRFKAGKDPKTNEPVYEEFESEDRFHDSVRTLRGMYRAETTKRQTAEQTSRANEQAAREWMALAQAYERGERTPPKRDGAAPNGAPNGQPTATERAAAGEAAAETGAPEDAIVRKIDWNAYRQVRAEARAAEQRGEIPAGEGETLVHAWLTRETAKLVRADLEGHVAKRFEDASAPQRAQEALIGHARDLTEAVDALERDMVFAAGTPYYPELADPEVREELGALIYAEVQRLVKLGVPEDKAWANAKTREGLHSAVILHRDWRRATGRSWKPNGSSANGNGQVAGAASGQPPAAAPDGKGVTGGIEGAMRSIAERNAGVVTGGSMPPRPLPAGKGPAHDLRAALKGAGGNALGAYPWPD